MQLAGAALFCFGCEATAADDDARGLGLTAAALEVPRQVRLYASAARAAFDPSPDLTLLLEPTLLPRSSGYEGGEPMAVELRDALQKTKVVTGTCAPESSGETRAPTCPAPRAGYVLRASPIFQREGDTVLVYLLSTKFATPGVGQQPFSFEMAYQLVPDGQGWRVVREGRVRQEGSKD